MKRADQVKEIERSKSIAYLKWVKTELNRKEYENRFNKKSPMYK